MLNDVSVIVTGGANGLGSHYCQHLVRAGARVAVADVDEESAIALAKRLDEENGAGRCLPVRADATCERDVAALVAATIEAFGGVDVLVNNAGTYPHTPVEQITYDLWRQVLAVNLDSAFLCCRAVLPQMRAQGRGKIVNIATNLVWLGLPEMTHYIAAKAGVVGLTRALAREVGGDGITVNALAPGAVVPQPSALDDAGLARLEQIVSHQCVGWCERPADLVGPLLFLVSPAADFISGQVLTVDGGLTMH